MCTSLMFGRLPGHYDFYGENMYFFNINEGSEENPRLSEYGVKPMNCPGHVLIYRNEIRSYRDLPLQPLRVRYGIPP